MPNIFDSAADRFATIIRERTAVTLPRRAFTCFGGSGRCAASDRRNEAIVNRETHMPVLLGFRAIAVASIFFMVPGCTSLSSSNAPAGGPASAVTASNVSVSEVKDAPDPVSDTEVFAAQAALRDAATWGAQYYKPEMYAQAQAFLDAAIAARESDPSRCLSLLGKAVEAASSAREAALLAYENDVKTRFESSQAKLVEIGADRAFPDEFGRLVSGIDATISLFAAGSYWEARFRAYSTLKDMSNLYETVRGLSNWLRDARVRVESALSAARELDAPRWAPAEMKNAEQKYRDALAQMEAGDLKAAVDSMTAAGQIAVRLPLLRQLLGKREEGAPVAAQPAIPERNPEVQGPNPGLQPPAGDTSSVGQRVRIGNMSMSSLGGPQRLYTIVSAAVARFDLVAAEGLRDVGIMEKVLSGMDEGWEAAVSRRGYFGFIYNDRIEMVKDLGIYPGRDEFVHTPYAAQFRLAGTRFSMNLVLCHVETGKDGKPNPAEISHLADVYRYFEKLTGHRGITLLLSGGLGGIQELASGVRVPQREMVALRSDLKAAGGRHDQGQRMFASAGLGPLIEESGFGASTPPVAYVVLKTRMEVRSGNR